MMRGREGGGGGGGGESENKRETFDIFLNESFLLFQILFREQRNLIYCAIRRFALSPFNA